MPKINPMTSASSGTSSGAVPFRQDARTIGLVGLAHGSSHFFHMLLPPLFPWLIAEFGFSYSELGVLVSVFFVISGVGQALSGFLVDRVGARPLILGATYRWLLTSIDRVGPTSRLPSPGFGCTPVSPLRRVPPSRRSTLAPRSADPRSCAFALRTPAQGGLRSCL